MSEPMTPIAAEPARDYLKEAQLILMNRTMLLPERAHLGAVQDECNRLALIVALQNRALLALMLSVKQTAFKVEPRHVQSIESQGLDISIGRPSTNDPIVVRIVRPTNDPAKKV